MFKNIITWNDFVSSTKVTIIFGIKHCKAIPFHFVLIIITKPHMFVYSTATFE